MKKLKLTISFFGAFFVFASSLNVCAKSKIAKESVSGYLDYFFEKSMNKFWYKNGIMPPMVSDIQDREIEKINEALKKNGLKKVIKNEKEASKLILKDNKTNEIQAMGMFFKAYAAINKLQKQGGKISEEIKDEILNWFASPCKQPNLKLNRIIAYGTQFFSLSKEGYEVFKKILKLEKFEFKKDVFEAAKKDLLKRMKKSIELEKVMSEKADKKAKDSLKKSIYLIEKEMKKIKGLDFEKVKEQAEKLEWRKDLRKTHDAKG